MGFAAIDARAGPRPGAGLPAGRAARRPAASFRPRLERLEDRRVLSHTAAGTPAEFVTALYDDVLGREPDAEGRDNWVNALNAGASPASVAAAFWFSEEHRLLQIERYYTEYLNRASDASGRSFWLRQFGAGLTEAEIQLGFIQSTEYQNLHPSNEDFVTALYDDVLGRAPDDGGLASWVARLDSGNSRGSVAVGFLQSQEELTQVVDAYYLEFFNRTADPAGRDNWVSALSRGALNQSQVAVIFLSSEEYFLVCCSA